MIGEGHEELLLETENDLYFVSSGDNTTYIIIKILQTESFKYFMLLYIGCTSI